MVQEHVLFQVKAHTVWTIPVGSSEVLLTQSLQATPYTTTTPTRYVMAVPTSPDVNPQLRLGFQQPT